MLDIAISVHREFHLPCTLAVAGKHFRDFRRMLDYLPELELVAEHDKGRYRILYTADIRGVYRVNLYSDIEVRFDGRRHVLHVTPLEGILPVIPYVTPLSLCGQGSYGSTLALARDGAETHAVYELRIAARMHTPLSLMLLPPDVAKGIVEAVVLHKAEDMTERFIDRSIATLGGRNTGSVKV